MKTFLIILFLLCAPVVAQQQVLVKNEPVAWCEITNPSAQGEDIVYVLECAGDKIKLTLDIPKDKWFANWESPGSRKFHALGRGDDGKLYPLKTLRSESPEKNICHEGVSRGESCTVHGGKFIKPRN